MQPPPPRHHLTIAPHERGPIFAYEPRTLDPSFPSRYGFILNDRALHNLPDHIAFRGPSGPVKSAGFWSNNRPEVSPPAHLGIDGFVARLARLEARNLTRDAVFEGETISVTYIVGSSRGRYHAPNFTMFIPLKIRIV